MAQMGRKARYTFPLADGRTVGANYKVRGGYFMVQFRHPTEPEKYVEVSTGLAVPDGWKPEKKNGDKADPPPDWFTEASKLITEKYAPTVAPDLKRATWEQAMAELAKAPIRPKTLVTYQTAINNLTPLLPEAKGPGEVTPELATRFVRLFASTPYKRGKASDAKTYTRSAQTVWNQIANLSIVWSHFSDLGYVSSNPWEKVKRPKLPKRVPVVPDEGHVQTLLDWLEARFPGWELARLFVEVKMLAGCRLNDLCQVGSHQLRGNVLVIDPSQDKTHRERVIPLPAELADRLHAVKGKTYLWERYIEDTATYRPGRRRATTFTPAVMYNGMKWVFKQYAKAHPDKKVKTHDLRKRAITLTVMATQGAVDQAAQAIGINPQTARRYYVDAGRALDGAELLRKMAGVLLPQKTPQNSAGQG